MKPRGLRRIPVSKWSHVTYGPAVCDASFKEQANASIVSLLARPRPSTTHSRALESILGRRRPQLNCKRSPWFGFFPLLTLSSRGTRKRSNAIQRKRRGREERQVIASPSAQRKQARPGGRGVKQEGRGLYTHEAGVENTRADPSVPNRC